MSKRHSTKDAQPNFAFRLADQHLLREMDPARGPRVQVFSGLEEEEEEEQYHYCPNCESILDRVVPNIDEWLCKECGIIISSWTYDRPLVTDQDSKLKIPFGQRGQYPTYQESDEIPYLKSWNPDQEAAKDNQAYETTWSDNTGRVKHIRIKPGHSITEYDIMRESNEQHKS